MANRRNRQTEPAADQHDQTDQPIGTDTPPDPYAGTITMSEFMSMADRGEFKTIQEAAKYLGIGPDKTQPLHNAARKRAEFVNVDPDTGRANMLRVRIEGTEITPLTYVRTAALDRYRENKERDASGTGTGTGRGGRTGPGGTIKRVVRMTRDQITEYDAGRLVLSVDTFKLEAPSNARTRRADTNGTSDQTPIEAAIEAASDQPSAEPATDQTAEPVNVE